VGKMKRLTVIFLAAALLLALPSLALAQEGAKYNFASVQGGKQIKATPGGEGEGVIYFYNIDGNRITHVTLEVSEAPANWEVAIQPPQHEIQVEIGGRIVTVAENLHVSPSALLSQETEDIPEGMACIVIPSRGYAMAQVARVIVRVPESAEIGTRGDIVISAEAEWLGQGGAAAIKQARDFEFSVEVISAETNFTETIVGESDESEVIEPTKTTAGESTLKATEPAKTTTSEVETPEASSPAEPPAGEEVTSGFSITGWLPAIIAGVIVVLGAILIPVFVARKRRWLKRSN